MSKKAKQKQLLLPDNKLIAEDEASDTFPKIHSNQHQIWHFRKPLQESLSLKKQMKMLSFFL
ncbi:hypothetical protein EO244_04835 [Ancylomarina salipaludis]|uniref:Uncharacterized protein n=1 Tax=Ancylomarina salipaludis TaxID=2501299 RepID=A0A4Q1JPK7_9BACT|nr:hypothetical protein [Ancylomarina salipaludis]RXQ96170.1 hypothetical protein EO244_04835 [Ancylomarina salipaludis]